MSVRPNQPGDPTPPPLNEEHMLEWIEGRLSRIEEGNRASGTRPGVADRVRQMQANRRALQGRADERAPAELMERVLAALEREALLGLTNGQDVHEHPPISIAPHIERTHKHRKVERWAPGLALAAGLLLLVGGAAYWGSVLVKPAPKPVTGDLATTQQNPTQPEVGAPSEAEASRMATRSGPTADTVEPAPETAPGAANAEMTSLAALTAPLSEERVLELARQGRLVIRVYAKETRGLAQIEKLDSLKNGRTWRVSKEVPGEVVAAVMPVEQPVGPPSRETPDPVLAAMVPAIGQSIVMGWPVDPMMSAPIARVRATYLVDFLDTSRSLHAVKVTFADRLKSEVVFEELPEALALPRVEDPDAMLWWTLPPSQWTQRVTVPVVVESR